ncbi:MAG: Ig-like domain repeat protein [Acidobacteria bacterium]|nr:Ig-like domain repeat protein [Acidobacteriota bacterium]
MRLRVFAAAALLSIGLHASGQRMQVAPASTPIATALDLGIAPVSAPMEQVIVTLQGSATQQSALSQLLADQVTPGSSSFHQWLTPQQFADRFQPTEQDAARVAQWFAAQGMDVDAVNASRTSFRVHGTVAQMQRAFGTTIARVMVDGIALRTTPQALTLPMGIAPLVSNVEGVSETDLRPEALAALQQFAAAVDANADAVLTLQSSEICSASEAAALRSAFTPVLQQAAAQGITVFVAGNCVTKALAPATGLATAVHLQSDPIDGAVSLAADESERPSWQVAGGLPESALRAVPDISLDGDLASLEQAFKTIVARAGVRQGSANAELYALAAQPGIYIQPLAGAVWQSGTGLGVVDLDRLIEAWPHGSGVSQVSISSDDYNPIHGIPFELTAIVDAPGATCVPTGTVTFTNSKTGTLSTVLLTPLSETSAKATYTAAGLPSGTYIFNAAYAGDKTYAGATSSGNPAIVVVQREPSNIFATADAEPVDGNIPVTITVRSTNGKDAPTGTVSIATQGSSSTPYTGKLVAISKNMARATVNVPAAQWIVPITATNSTVPSSSRLKDGIEGLRSGTPLSDFAATRTNGVATTRSLTAVYAGDSNYAPATSNPIKMSGPLASTTTSLTASNYAASYGTSISLNSAVSPSSLVNGTAPTGTITFLSSLQGVLGTVPYTGASVSFPISTLQTGTHMLTAMYSGDSLYAPSTNTSNVQVTVSSVIGMLTATISPTTAVGYGTTATVNATVNTASGSAPSGTVTATVNGVSGGVYSAALVPDTSSSSAGIAIASPPPGTYTVTIACTTTANLSCSNTVTLAMKVAKGTTSTALSLTPSAPQAGMKVALTANVTAVMAGRGLFTDVTGSVTFFDNGKSLGAAPLGAGIATVSVALTGKAHALTATYSGDMNWSSSTSPSQIVIPTAVDGVLTVNANNLAPLAGANVVLTAALTAPSGATLTPTGVIQFFDVVNGASKLLGSATLLSNGVDGGSASISTTGFVGGIHNVYAAYAGDGSFIQTRSSNLAIAVGDFSLSMNPATLALTRGTAAVASGTVTLLSGFNGTVTLGCTPPASTRTTCQFGPAEVTSGGSTTLSILTTANTSMARPAYLRNKNWPVGAALATLCCCGIFARKRRNVPKLLVIALLTAFAATTIGCADGALSGNNGTIGGGSVPNVGNGTPLGTMVFTLTAAATDGSTTVRHQYFYQVTVQ